MKKLFLSSMILVVLISNIKAQKGDNFLKIHAGAELTTSLFADGYSTGWGIYATDYYGVSNDGNLVISTGVASWKVKDSPGKAGMFLTRIGYRQFLAEGFYLQADAGIGVGLENFSGATRFNFGGGLGYLFKNKKGSGFDISARANRGFGRTWIGLGAGYQFKL